MSGMSEKAKADWGNLCKHSKGLKEARDCAVKAISIVTDTHYVDVHSLLARYGRRPCSGTFRPTQQATIRHLGFTTTWVEVKSRTVRTLGREFKGRPGTFLAWTVDHVLAIKDGEVMDWTNGRLHRIVKVVEIKQKERSDG